MKKRRFIATTLLTLALASSSVAAGSAAYAWEKSGEGLYGSFSTKASCEYQRKITANFAKVSSSCFEIGGKWFYRIG